jgi:hypothetical protein
MHAIRGPEDRLLIRVIRSTIGAAQGRAVPVRVSYRPGSVIEAEHQVAPKS